MEMSGETIFALASGRGRAGIAVIRISGPDAMTAARRLVRKELPVRRAVRVGIRMPDSDELLDRGLAVFFPGPASFTGEDVVEVHVHGGMAVIDGVLGALSGIDGLRMAQPGEFTRRGFENGKIDLTAAEGVADLVAADTAAQRRQALRQMGGALAEFCEAARHRLVGALAHWEAAIDFSDEELPQDLEARVLGEVEALASEVDEKLADSGRGERLREGIEVAIVGPPNAGKSSLLNHIAGRDVAIVSATAGTTRDVLEVHTELGGYPVILADTAGLREAADAIEEEGVRRAQARAAVADFCIVVLDGETWPHSAPELEGISAATAVVAVNKADIMAAPVSGTFMDMDVIAVSAKTGAGVADLLGVLEGRVGAAFEMATAPVVTRARHREALQQTRSALGRFLAASDRLTQPELSAEDLRLAARALGRVTGSVDVEDLLDVIFSEFCIGK